jgi:hypothetical protein
MTSAPISQLTLNLEPSVVDRWETLREYVAHRVNLQAKHAKTIAADLDISPSTLSKKLRGEDNNRFTVDNLEQYIESTGDVAAVVEYLATKYMRGGDVGRRERLMAQAEAAAAQLTRLVTELKGAA